MKKILLLTILCSCHLAADISSHTFFSIRPPFQSTSPELVSLSYDRADAAIDGAQGAIRLNIFGGQSTHENNLAHFFMPFGKTCIRFGELGSDLYKEGNADVLSTYFGVATGTIVSGSIFQQDNLVSEGTLSMYPRQSSAGIGIQYKQRLSGSDQDYNDHGFWCSISAPIVWVKNELNFQETITKNGTGTTPTGYVETISQALQGKTVFGDKKFCYGKIPTGRQRIIKKENSSVINSVYTFFCESTCGQIKWGIADIDAKLGYIWTRQPDYAAESYIGVIIPTGNKPTAEYIFEPIIGNNHHFGATWGGTYACELGSNDHAALWLEVSSAGQYLFKNEQRRSFDLVNKDWSRYIWVYKNDQATPFYGIEPGINYLTQPVKVTPRFSGAITTALMATNRRFVAEVGINLFARQSEKIQLCCMPKGVGIAGFNFHAINDPIRTQSHATMQLFNEELNDATSLGNPKFVPLQRCDLNLESAAHPATITHTIYSSIGCRCNEDGFAPVQLAMGGSYEFSEDNAGLNRWLMWGSLTMSF